MDFWMKILGSIVAPLLLFYIGWRGIPQEKRKGALLVCLIMVAVILTSTLVYMVVMILGTPKWIARDCEAAYDEIVQSPQSTEPSLARESFLKACKQLTMSAAKCTSLRYAAKFPDSCDPYLDEIHQRLPKLDLKIPPQVKK